jgi:hypothetical protein
MSFLYQGTTSQNYVLTEITAICRLQKNEMRDDIFWVICGELSINECRD